MMCMSVTEKALASWYKTQEGAKVVALEKMLLARIVEHFRHTFVDYDFMVISIIYIDYKVYSIIC